MRCETNENCALGTGRVQACVGQTCVKCDGDLGSGAAAPCALGMPICDLATGSCGPCDPIVCTGGGNQCSASGCLQPCNAPGECTAAQTCSKGFCVPKMPRGASCVSGDECISGACTESRCGVALGATCAADAECLAGVCGADKKCGVPPGGACFEAGQCRSGACTGRVCGSAVAPTNSPAILPETIVLVNGRLYFSQATLQSPNVASIYSCAVTECPAGVTPLVMLPGASATLLAGDAQSLFFLQTVSTSSPLGGLVRCDLPACAAPVDMRLSSLAPLEISSEEVFAFDAPSGSLVACPRSGCTSSARLPLPDLHFAADPSPTTQEQLAGHAFSFDAANVYWATRSVFGQQGNIVLASPR